MMVKLCKLWLKNGKNMVDFNKTSLGETGCLGNPYFLLTGAYASSFLIHCAETW